MTKVFISYSHDSDAHRERVLDLSDRLRTDGIDCDIDQYNPAPEQGWPRWMMQGIQQADYVLLVCTETYRKRLELEEEQGKGLGVKWEGSLIFNILYRNETFNTKFIPLIFDTENKAYIPDILFGYDYHDLSQPRGYDNLYRHIRGELGAEKPPLGKPHYTRTIYSNSLPTVEGKLFGRKDELALLDKAWADPQTHVVQFVASGGTGKTKLLKHWLDTNTDSIEALIAWSFYSQGSSEDKQVSATPFFSHVFGVLKSEKTQFSSEEEKGEHLAHLLRQRRCLLVLDGLEPLQHAGRGMRGELKDRAIRQLLKSLAGEYNSLCIITTRIAVHELSDRRAHVISHDLQNLAPADGVSLLKSWQVHGSDKELEKAVHEYGCHALALHLLGNALHTYLDGDARKRDTLDELLGDYDAIERHAFKVMQAYRIWLADTPELKLLYLLGLFDHPIELEVLEVLWEAQISQLTNDIPIKAWKIAIRDLREKHRLLSSHEGRTDLLDCHPLIREYFGKQLKENQPEVWQQAHERLYEYYKALPEDEFPNTLEEMRPLFSAVAHGCKAGLSQQVLDAVYRPRIRRGQNYICDQLGAFSDALATVGYFFTESWKTPARDLTEYAQAVVLNWAGFLLRASGRLNEALEPMQANAARFERLHDWEGAAQALNNLSEVQLILGMIAQAKVNSQRSVDYADSSKVLFRRMDLRTTNAEINYQSDENTIALILFREAELLQKEYQRDYPRLYSLPGFRYCDLLLALGSTAEVLERAEYALSIAQELQNLLSVALDQLTFGRAHLQQGDFQQAAHWLDQAVAGLRAAGTQHHLPRGLLARAKLYRKTGKLDKAYMDLQEVFDIAEPSGMRLHLTDYHLEMARLLLAEEENSPQSPFCKGGSQEAAGSAVPPFVKGGLEGISLQAHIEAAAKLIQETGYHRRDPELAALKQALQNT